MGVRTHEKYFLTVIETCPTQQPQSNLVGNSRGANITREENKASERITERTHSKSSSDTNTTRKMVVRCSAAGRCTTLLTGLLLPFPFFLLSFSISCSSSISNFLVVLIIWSNILTFVPLSCVSAGFARVCEFDRLLSLVQQRFSLLCYNCVTLLWSFWASASLFIFKLFVPMLQPSFEICLNPFPSKRFPIDE